MFHFALLITLSDVQFYVVSKTIFIFSVTQKLSELWPFEDRQVEEKNPSLFN